MLQVLIEYASALGIESSLRHVIAREAVRDTEWVTNHLVRTDSEVEGGGVIKQSCNKAYTRKAAPTSTAGFLERILVERREEESKPPRF